MSLPGGEAPRRVAVPRASFAEAARSVGWEALTCPWTEQVFSAPGLVAAADVHALWRRLMAGPNCPDGFDWLVATSAATAAALVRLDVRGPVPAGVRVAAVGPRTARALEGLGLGPAEVPSRRRAEGLVEELGIRGRVLLPQSLRALPRLRADLALRGAQVEAPAVYDTLARPPERLWPELAPLGGLPEPGRTAVLLTSPSAVRAYLGVEDRLPGSTRILTIGPTTTAAARTAGLAVDGECGEPTPAGLAVQLGRLDAA